MDFTQLLKNFTSYYSPNMPRDAAINWFDLAFKITLIGTQINRSKEAINKGIYFRSDDSTCDLNLTHVL